MDGYGTTVLFSRGAAPARWAASLARLSSLPYGRRSGGMSNTWRRRAGFSVAICRCVTVGFYSKIAAIGCLFAVLNGLWVYLVAVGTSSIAAAGITPPS